MPSGALARARAPGRETGDRRGARDLTTERGTPPWRAWRTRSRAARAIRFIETYCRIPSGAGAGQLLKLARYQKHDLEVLLAEGNRTGGLQIPRGNAKSTLWAAVGIWAVCDHPDAPQVPLVGFNGLQVNRTLFRPAVTMIRNDPELEARTVVYASAADRRIWSGWNDGELLPLPADEDRLQGLNPTLALVDEAQTVTPDVWRAVLQGAGKRPASLVLAIGTPAPGQQTSALFALREQAASGARVAWIEYAADTGCAIDDRRQWRKANPALDAGILFPDVLEGELETIDEPRFRMYRLGQWIDATLVDWLPASAWDDLAQSDTPADGADVILAVAGTWTSSVAVVGCTPDGAMFLAYAAETMTDDELDLVLDAAHRRWHVLECVFAPRVRPNLVRSLLGSGLEVDVWPRSTDLEVTTSTEWRRAILEGRVAHDHDPTLAQHVAALVGVPTADGNLRLGPGETGDVDAAQAARMAWWRAIQNDDYSTPVIY